MSGARDIILNGLAQSDLDGGGHKLINWDTSNLVLGSFGAQLANRIYAGPASGSAAIPSFRIIGPDEVGAQPHSTNLDLLAAVTPSEPGLKFLTLPIPALSGYTKVQKVGAGTIVSVLTQAQLLVDIEAQPLSAGLTLLSPLTPSDTGMAMLVVDKPAVAGYPRHSGLAELQPWSFQTPEELAAELGVLGGGAGGAGQGDDLAYTTTADVTLDPPDPFIQYFQVVSIGAGASDNYAVGIILGTSHAAKGARLTVRLEFAFGCIATVTIADGSTLPVPTLLLTVSGDAELPANVFEATFVFNGNAWGNPSGGYVNL